MLVFSSCGDDKDKSMALRYIDTQSGLENFRMYVGTAQGGTVVDTDTLKRKANAFFPNIYLEGYTNAAITFFDTEMIIEQSSIVERFRYEFKDGSLFLYKSDNQPRYYGDGDRSALDIRQHYIGYKTGDGNFKIIQATPVKEPDKDMVAAQSSFQTIENMTNEADTLIWATRRAVFR